MGGREGGDRAVSVEVKRRRVANPGTFELEVAPSSLDRIFYG